MISKYHGVPADCVKRVGLPLPLASGAVYIKGLPGMVESLIVAAPPVPCPGQAKMGVRLAGLVLGLAKQVQGVLEFGAGIVEPATSAVSRISLVSACSRSLIDRGLIRAASASSSCVSPASLRNWRSSAANVTTGGSATTTSPPAR